MYRFAVIAVFPKTLSKSFWDKGVAIDGMRVRILFHVGRPPVAPTGGSNFDLAGRLKHPNQHHTNVIPRVATKPPVGISQNARGVLRGMFAPNFYEA